MPRNYDIGRKRSGEYKNPRRLITQTAEDFAKQEEAATAAGSSSWSEWAKEALQKAAKRQLAKK